MDRRGIFLGLAFASMVVASAACSSSGGTGISTPRPTPSGVVLGTLGNVTCTAPNNAVPGTYVTLDDTEGQVSGTTYLQGDSEFEGGDFYTSAYAEPAPSSSPVATSPPEPIASVPPTTPGAVLAIVYYGEYTVPATAGLTTGVSNGCFQLDTANFPFLEEEVGSTTRRTLGTRSIIADASPSPSPSPFDAEGGGYLAFGPPYPTQSDDIVDGNIPSFTITNLTRTTGTGTFTLSTADVGDTFNATGTVVITGSTAFYVTPEQEAALKRRAAQHHFRRR